MVVAFPGRLRFPKQQDDGAVCHVDDFESFPVGRRSEVAQNCVVTDSPGLRNVSREHVAYPRRM
eukprot:12826383-Heterocapsa_arctica.AAC.1